jgi:hypothetical protein
MTLLERSPALDDPTAPELRRGPVRNPHGHPESLRGLAPYKRCRHLPDIDWRPKKARDALHDQVSFLLQRGEIDDDMAYWLERVAWQFSNDGLDDCVPSHAAIARACGRTISWSRTTVKALKQLGILGVEHRFRLQPDGSIKATSNRYRFLFLKAFQESREDRRIAKITATQRARFTRRTNDVSSREIQRRQAQAGDSPEVTTPAELGTFDIDASTQASLARAILKGEITPRSGSSPPA